MLEELSEYEFLNLFDKKNFRLLIQNKTSIHYGLTSKYLVYKNKVGEYSIRFFLYINRNSIVHPNIYHYSFIWIKDDLNTKNSRKDLNNAIESLIKQYKKIEFRLINIKDLRAFLGHNFFIQLRYTYVKRTEDTNYSYNVVKHYKRATSIYNLNFREEFDFKQIFQEQYDFLNKKEIRMKSKTFLFNYLKTLYDEKLISCFSVNNLEGKRLASGIVLINEDADCGYFLFCSSLKTENKSAVNAFMYIEIQKWLFKNQISYFDYLGANYSNIAEFKQNFLPELKPYYILKYNPTNVKLNTLKLTLKNIIRSCLSS